MPECKHYRIICPMCRTIVEECDCKVVEKPETSKELCDVCNDDDENSGGRKYQRRTKVKIPIKIV